MRKYQFISEEKLNKKIHRDSIKTDLILSNFGVIKIGYFELEISSNSGASSLLFLYRYTISLLW